MFDPLNYEQNLLTAVPAPWKICRTRCGRYKVRRSSSCAWTSTCSRSAAASAATCKKLTQLRARIGEGDALALKVRETDTAFERLYPNTFTNSLTSDELGRAARSRWEEAHAGFRRGRAAAGTGQRDDR